MAIDTETHRVNTTCARGLHVSLMPRPRAPLWGLGTRLASCVKMDIATGKTFDSFSELEAALEELRKNGCHPLRVYNRLLKTITENDSVPRIPWIRLTLKSFGTRTTALDVSTMAKQGIVARG